MPGGRSFLPSNVFTSESGFSLGTPLEAELFIVVVTLIITHCVLFGADKLVVNTDPIFTEFSCRF